jgi:ATP-dependent DNA helicase DinG
MQHSISDFFAAGGPIDRALPTYVSRTQQIDSSTAVEKAFANTGSVALVEAGTGVGKTLAYLVPTLFYARPETKVVISTHTLALQAQLWQRDIPLAIGLSPKRHRTALLKGRGNYLCLQEMYAAREDIWTAGDRQFDEILDWSSETETGDLAELSFNYPEWSEISANPDTCRGAECRYFDDCFFYKAKRLAEDAAVVLVNHSLYFSDLAMRHVEPEAALLPDHSFIVFDEAHHLENAASRAFGITVTSSRIAALLKRLRRMGNRLELDEERMKWLERESAEFFAPFKDCGRQEFSVNEIMPDLTWAKSKTELIASILEDIATRLGKVDTSDDRILRERVDGLTRQTVRLREELDSLFNLEDANHVRWGSVTRLRDGSAFVSLNWTPISVAPLLSEALWKPNEHSVALISATLATNGGFDYLKERLGLSTPSPQSDFTEQTPVRQTQDTECVELIADSPFDYQNHCRLYIPRHLPQPNDSMDYTTQVINEIEQLVYASNGGAFLLFTSHRMLQHAYSLIVDSGMPYPIFRQGEMPSGRLIEQFRSSRNGVLFGTQSFWEGVDVPGESLRLVVVDRLPFGSPDNPMHKARVNAITRAGGDWFRDYALPQAQLKLKQGFGRLIRNSTDRGVVAILDTRLIGKNYGPKFIQYLPNARRVFHIDEVKDFYLEDHALG